MDRRETEGDVDPVDRGEQTETLADLGEGTWTKALRSKIGV